MIVYHSDGNPLSVPVRTSDSSHADPIPAHNQIIHNNPLGSPLPHSTLTNPNPTSIRGGRTSKRLFTHNPFNVNNCCSPSCRVRLNPHHKSD